MRRVPLAMTSVLAASLGAAGAYGRPLPKGRLAALARPGATWTLPVHDPPAPWGPDAAPTPASVTVTVTSVRTLGQARVATLTWTTPGPDGPEPITLNGVPDQLAFTRRGVYAFAPATTDARLVAALKRRPTFADPPRAARVYQRPDGTFAFAPADRAGALCVGFGATDPTCGDDPCYAWICLDEHGVIGVGGIGDDNGFDFGFVPDRFPGDAPE